MTNLGNERKDFHVAGSRVKTLRRTEDRSTLYYQSALLVLCLILRPCQLKEEPWLPGLLWERGAQ